jgi:hypothetical protein
MSACTSCSSAPRARALSLGSAALLVLMPKCPLCFVAWAAALGLGSYAIHAAVIPVVVLALFCALQASLFARRELRAAVAASLGIALVVLALR